MINIVGKSTRPEPNLGNRRHTGIQLIIHILWQLVIKLIFRLVHSVRGMSPPSIQETEEEHWIDQSGVKVRCVNVEHTISLHRWWWSTPKLPVLRKWTRLGNQTCISSRITGNVLRHEGLRHLHLACVQTDVFLSAGVNVPKLRSLLLELDLKNRVSVSEVQWRSVLGFTLWKILSSHLYFNIYITQELLIFSFTQYIQLIQYHHL